MARSANLELKQAIFNVCGQLERRPTSTEVLAQLELLEYPEIPHERTIRRYLGEWDESEKRGETLEYGFARWPESFGSGLLPWEAAPAVLEYIALCPRRPSVRAAQWFWRISTAAPSLPIGTRMQAAATMELAYLAADPESFHRAVEAHLMGLESAPAISQLQVRLPPGFAKALRKQLDELMQRYPPETTLGEIEELEEARHGTQD